MRRDGALQFHQQFLLVRFASSNVGSMLPFITFRAVSLSSSALTGIGWAVDAPYQHFSEIYAMMTNADSVAVHQKSVRTIPDLILFDTVSAGNACY